VMACIAPTSKLSEVDELFCVTWPVTIPVRPVPGSVNDIIPAKELGVELIGTTVPDVPAPPGQLSHRTVTKPENENPGVNVTSTMSGSAGTAALTARTRAVRCILMANTGADVSLNQVNCW